MGRKKRRKGLTRVEMLLVVGILGCVFAVLLPLILDVRDFVRKSACGDNLRKIGVALSAYEEILRVFPASSGVSRNAAGKITAVDGWSWQATLFPFMEGSGLWLSRSRGNPLKEPAGVTGTPNADALAMSFPWLLCPSYGGSPYADPATKRQAITNYKAMGATHIESLSIASPHPLTPKYGVLRFERPASASSRRRVLPRRRAKAGRFPQRVFLLHHGRGVGRTAFRALDRGR